MNKAKSLTISYILSVFFASFLFVSGSLSPAFASMTYNANPPDTVAASSGNAQEGIATCNVNNQFWVEFFVDYTANTLNWYYSSDGHTWTTGGLNIVSLTNPTNSYYGSCSSYEPGNGATGYFALTWGGSDNYQYFLQCTATTGATVPSVNCGSVARLLSKNGNPVKPTGAFSADIEVFGGQLFQAIPAAPSGQGIGFYANGVNTANITVTNGFNSVKLGCICGTASVGTLFMFGYGSGSSSMYEFTSTDNGGHWSVSSTLTAPGGNFVTFRTSSNGISWQGSYYLFFVQTSGPQLWNVQIGSTGIPISYNLVGTVASSTAPAIYVATDNNNVVVSVDYFTAGTVNFVAWVTNPAATWTTNTYNTVATGTGAVDAGGQFTGTLTAFLVNSGNTGAPKALTSRMFGTWVSGVTVSTTQGQTIGSCPTTQKASMYLKNATQYWFSGNALGNEVVNQIQVEVESIKGSAPQTLQLLLYGTSGTQSPSVGSPANLMFAKSYTVSPGTINNTIILNINVPLNAVSTSPLPFNFWAVGIVGTDHIKVENSTVTGMTTQTGAASILSQPTSFTSQGVATNAKLGLCAVASYQGVFTQTTTFTTGAGTVTQTGGQGTFTISTTITSGGTTYSFTFTQTTSSILVTSSSTTVVVTQTVSTIGAGLFTQQSNWPIIFLILLLPSGLFLGVTKTLAGALLGLMVGAVIGLMMGILPSFVFIGIVISLAAVAFIARERSG